MELRCELCKASFVGPIIMSPGDNEADILALRDKLTQSRYGVMRTLVATKLAEPHDRWRARRLSRRLGEPVSADAHWHQKNFVGLEADAWERPLPSFGPGPHERIPMNPSG